MLPVHGLGGVILEPEDQSDVVGAADLTREDPGHALEARHPDDRN